MRIDFDIHPAAQTEFYDTIRHYAALDEQDQPLAAAFDATFNRHLSLILDNPLIYNLRRPPTRRANLTPRFDEHYIAYMVWRERVVILAIAHAKRRPYYWRNRVSEAKKLF
ncbi:MAG: type II toxin-antitoxin system RelE/ParE family toxin [Prosthecobacter sp.]|uniref:type II toxin-antitoxin system RelE/ParE family toxin n=1 Tax=Prosthecobacter sp. TaxID=1965333 RepID=UPI003BB174FB